VHVIEEPVAILVGMAEKGEIDPWRIDIVEVTDRFLSELERQKTLDLRISGRTLFYASLLLRMKSEYLLDPPEEDGDPEGEDDDAYDWDLYEEPTSGEPIARLEAEIHRRLERKRLRKRPETLFDLITVLRYLERDEQRRRRCVRAPPLVLDPGEVIGIAHEEGYRDAAGKILEWCLAGFAEGRRVTVSSLTTISRWTVVDVYIPLLFLMLDGTVDLVQEEFFGEIEVLPAL
jgi:segregation and condensation protein A